MRLRLILICFALALAPTARATTPALHTSTVMVRAALVGPDMQVRPVPLHPLELVKVDGDTLRARTSIRGVALFNAPPGQYTLSSQAGTPFGGRTYRWHLAVEVVGYDTTRVDLTNDNAAAETPPIAAVGANEDAAGSLFRGYGGSVFRIEAALTAGSGFLADTLGGVILTSADIVDHADSTEIYAVLDAGTRVHAQLLARDASAGIAVLRVHPDRIAGRRRIDLQGAAGALAISPGELVFAMGYPLHQELTIAAGIASSAHDGALTSDVSASPGSAGGPVFNAAGEAIAIDTFRDQSSGSGVAGAVLIARAGPALLRASLALPRSELPSPERLPAMPAGRFDMNRLKAAVDAIDLHTFPEFEDLQVAGFNITLSTPANTLIRAKQFDYELLKNRKKREAAAGIPAGQAYSTLRMFRDWTAFVGDLATPVVSLAVVPRPKQTLSSVMSGGYAPPEFKFAGDVRGVQVFRNDSLVTPLQGGHEPIRWAQVKDVADLAYYAFAPELLRPDSAGMPPQIVISIRDLKNPNSLKCTELPPRLVAEMWNGFESYFRGREASAPFVTAYSEAAQGRPLAAQRAGAYPECSWTRLASAPVPKKKSPVTRHVFSRRW